MRDSGWPSGQVCAIIQGSGAKTSVAHHYVSSDVDVVVGVGVLLFMLPTTMYQQMLMVMLSLMLPTTVVTMSADVDGEVVVGVVVHVAHPQHIIRS